MSSVVLKVFTSFKYMSKVKIKSNCNNQQKTSRNDCIYTRKWLYKKGNRMKGKLQEVQEALKCAGMEIEYYYDTKNQET